jgi:hypothetical protein
MAAAARHVAKSVMRIEGAMHSLVLNGAKMYATTAVCINGTHWLAPKALCVCEEGVQCRI